MNVEDTYSVVVVLVDECAVHASVFIRLLRRVADELAQGTFAGGGEGTGLFLDEADAAPCFARTAASKRHVEEPALADDGVDQCGRIEPPTLFVKRIEDGKRVHYRVRGIDIIRRRTAVVPTAASRGEPCEVRVGTAERGGAERGDDGYFVGRVVNRAEDGKHVAGFLRIEEEGLTFDAGGDTSSGEGLF